MNAVNRMREPFAQGLVSWRLGERVVTILVAIPARYASTRLPGKPLLAETGKPLIQHVWERVGQAPRVAAGVREGGVEMVVATDDGRIVAAVEAFGGRAEMTAADHRSGTDRIAELVRRQEGVSVVINVQGDEPEIEPSAIDALLARFDDPAVEMATLACPYPAGTPHDAPHAVKVVCDQTGRALYFSRAPIPFPRSPAGGLGGGVAALLHLGLYGYRRATLLRLAGLAPTPLESLESLEQLRALEHGIPIHVGLVAPQPPGIDTPEDYAAFVARVSRPA